MRNIISIYVDNKKSGRLIKTKPNRYVFNYEQDNPVSITMPFSHESYISEFYLHPIFDMYIPEGYLFEILLNLLRKETRENEIVDDFFILQAMGPAIESKLRFYLEEDKIEQPTYSKIPLKDVLESNDPDLFYRLVKIFLKRTALSGIQPKVLAPLYDKTSLIEEDCIIKTSGKEFPYLALNEYLCMQTVKNAGIPVPPFWLSANRELFVIKRFTFDPLRKKHLGFEEFCVLLRKNRTQKYNGSYEKIAKILEKISADPSSDLENYFKMVVLNYLVKNGDAHLKNFGIVYEKMGEFFLAPAYDVVCTVVYLRRDKPALAMFGKKVWFSRKKLIDFGVKHCLLEKNRAEELFEQCEQTVRETISVVERMGKSEPEVRELCDLMARVFRFSLEKNLKETFVTVPPEVFGSGLLETGTKSKRASEKEGAYPAGPGR